MPPIAAGRRGPGLVGVVAAASAECFSAARRPVWAAQGPFRPRRDRALRRLGEAPNVLCYSGHIHVPNVVSGGSTATSCTAAPPGVLGAADDASEGAALPSLDAGPRCNHGGGRCGTDTPTIAAGKARSDVLQAQRAANDRSRWASGAARTPPSAAEDGGGVWTSDGAVRAPLHPSPDVRGVSDRAGTSASA